MAKKIEQVASKYGIDTKKLEEKYRSGQGLRAVSKFWNCLVIQNAMQEQNEFMFDSEIENIVEGLSNQKGAVLDDIDARSQLRSYGIDADEIVTDFVSYQTVRHHLQEQGVDTSRSYEIQPEQEVDTVLRLKHRLEKVCCRSVQRLHREGYISITDPSVSAAITLKCSVCGGEWMLPNVIAEGVSCACSP